MTARAPAPPTADPQPDRAPDWVAQGTPEPLRSRLIEALGETQVLTSASDLIRYASDASPYRLIPQAVVRPRNNAEVAALLRTASQLSTPVVFRAGGTSLNGQTQTESILVDVRHHWQRARIEDAGARARLQPGVTLGLANRLLARHGRRLGPDPASTNIACVGGVVANNSGGMRCGVTADSYRTVRSMTLVLANGTVIDTAAPDAEQRFADGAPELAAGLSQMRDELRRRPGAVAAHRPQVRDQEHDRLPAVRLSGRRQPAGDLPASGGRLRGDAGVRGRGGVRDRALGAAHDAGAGRLRGPGQRRRCGRPAGGGRGQRYRADGRSHPDRRRLQHGRHAGGVEGAAADLGRAADRVSRRRRRRAHRQRTGSGRDPGRPPRAERARLQPRP